MAACVMCRAALDTAIYDMLSRPYEKNIIPVGEGYKINLEYVDLGYNEIKDAVKVKYDLGDGIFKKMKDLRGPGHFAAHYGQQQDKLIKEYSGIEGLIDTRGLKLWSDSTEAIILIENSFKILLLLIDKAKDEICLNNLRTMFKPVWYRDFNSRSLR